MEIMRLDHVGIRVMDFDRAVRFYRKFGFEPSREDHQERVVVLKHASGIELNLLDSGDDDYAGRNVLMDANVRYPGYTHYAIAVASIEDTRKFLEAAGITITEGPVTFGDRKTSVFIRDPDLNVIEFTELPKS